MTGWNIDNAENQQDVQLPAVDIPPILPIEERKAPNIEGVPVEPELVGIGYP